MPRLAELLQMSLQMDESDRQQQQLELAQMQQMQSAMQSFIGNLEMVQDPNQLEAMKSYYSDSYGIPREVLSEFTGQFLPSASNMQRNLTLGALKKMQGMPSGFVDETPQMEELMAQAIAASMTGMDQGRMAGSSSLAGAFRDPSMNTTNARRGQLFSATGYDPGRLALSESQAGLPQDALTRAANISFGTALNEGQVQQGGQFQQQFRESSRQFDEQMGQRQDEFNQEFGLRGRQFDRQVLESDYAYGSNLLDLFSRNAMAAQRVGEAAQKASSISPEEAAELYRKTLEQLEQTKGDANRQSLQVIADLYRRRAMGDTTNTQSIMQRAPAPAGPSMWERVRP
jgi:hypothetical protein